MNWVKEIIKSIFIIFVAYVVFIILDNSFSNFLKFNAKFMKNVATRSLNLT